MSPILSVVWCKAQARYSHFDYEAKIWIEKDPPLVVNKYIGSGGTMTDDLQKAQVFGFSPRAKKNLLTYRKDARLYEVRPILIQEV
jgi:hypothetical protein